MNKTLGCIQFRLKLQEITFGLSLNCIQQNFTENHRTTVRLGPSVDRDIRQLSSPASIRYKINLLPVWMLTKCNQQRRRVGQCPQISGKWVFWALCRKNTKDRPKRDHNHSAFVRSTTIHGRWQSKPNQWRSNAVPEVHLFWIFEFLTKEPPRIPRVGITWPGRSC